MKKSAFMLIFITSLLATACSKTLEVAANFPAYFSSQEINRDVDFGSPYGSKLDVYVPDDDMSAHPVIVFFYGGGWEFGSKSTYRFVADVFTKKGYVVVVPDYVKYPQHKFPDWQNEAAKAVEWTRNNIQQYKGNSENIFIMGHSAGAQIAALLAVDKKYGVRQYVKALAGLAGPYDFTPEEEDYKAMFANAGPNYKNIRVTNFIDGKQPPMLLLWGKKDETVGEMNITKVKAGLEAKGGEYKVIFYDGIGHIGIISALAPLSTSSAPVEDDVDTWFKKHLAK